MGDAAARREARRRKILQNSENRLKKITGVEQKVVQNDCIGKHALEEDLGEDHSVPNYFKEVNSHPSLHNKKNGGEFPPPASDVVQEKGHRGLHVHKISIIVCLAILANVTCVLEQLFLNIDLHFNVIFIPFLIFEALLLLGDESSSSHSQQSSPILSLLLASSKIDGALVGAAFKYMDVVSRVVQDAMIYFFVFVCCELLKIVVYSV